ncbi:MAG: aspartate kinase [Firmicutes bacterium]|nr:aspartate kinase [Bacillota bacterium]
MKILVQKFGGTSVATEESRAAAVQRIRQAQEDGFRPVVVVSAMGRRGDPYATDTLKGLGESIFPSLPLRELDLLMSCGEILSAATMVATLLRAGIKARSFTGWQAGLVTDGNYGQAQVVACHPEPLKQCLEEGKVAVVAGFQGATPEGEINTLSRGGSDTTAVILGAALKAERVEIYTDVSGIATADPRICKEARILRRLTYSEVCQLAYEGARVIHPAAVEIAMKHNVKVVVKSVLDAGPGTLIDINGLSGGEDYQVQPEKVITGIAHAPRLAQIMVQFNEPDTALEVEVFDRLAEAGISIDFINILPLLKIFTVGESDLERTREVLSRLGVSFRVETGCAKVSVVGQGMRGIPGVMARLVRVLNEQNIPILQTADSNITISLLIREQDLPGAVKVLHDHFALGEGENAYPPYSAEA